MWPSSDTYSNNSSEFIRTDILLNQGLLWKLLVARIIAPFSKVTDPYIITLSSSAVAILDCCKYRLRHFKKLANPVFILSSTLGSEFFLAKNSFASVNENSKSFVPNLNARGVIANLFWDVIFAIDWRRIYKFIRFLEYIKSHNIYKVLYINTYCFHYLNFYIFFIT